jgi:hypothetical protein
VNGNEQEINEQESQQEDKIIFTFLSGLADAEKEELKRLELCSETDVRSAV